MKHLNLEKKNTLCCPFLRHTLLTGKQSIGKNTGGGVGCLGVGGLLSEFSPSFCFGNIGIRGDRSELWPWNSGKCHQAWEARAKEQDGLPRRLVEWSVDEVLKLEASQCLGIFYIRSCLSS